MEINLIVAMSENRVIGKNNQLPWHLPADLQHFKAVTMGKPILMGRKTYESIGRPLPGRTNIVITRDRTFVAPGCIVADSIEGALNAAANSNEVFVIGGALLYEQMLPRTQKIYLTQIHHCFEGDTFFPALPVSEWCEVACDKHLPDDKNLFSYSFQVLERAVAVK